MLRKCILKNERLFRDQTQKPPIVARSSEAYLISKNSYDMGILAKAKAHIALRQLESSFTNDLIYTVNYLKAFEKLGPDADVAIPFVIKVMKERRLHFRTGEPDFREEG